MLLCTLRIVYVWGSRWEWSKQKKLKIILLCFALALVVGIPHETSAGAHSTKPRRWHLEPYNAWADGSPSARTRHTMVWGADEVLYMFGGYTDAGVSDELILLDVETRRWATIMPGGPAPSARGNHAMATCGHSIYMFGGSGFASTKLDHFAPTIFGQLWKLSIQTMLWTLLHTATGVPPSAQEGSAMASVGDYLVIFGGKSGGTSKQL